MNAREVTTPTPVLICAEPGDYLIMNLVTITG
jgi:hypothetical protein